MPAKRRGRSAKKPTRKPRTRPAARPFMTPRRRLHLDNLANCLGSEAALAKFERVHLPWAHENEIAMHGHLFGVNALLRDRGVKQPVVTILKKEFGDAIRVGDLDAIHRLIIRIHEITSPKRH